MAENSENVSKKEKKYVKSVWKSVSIAFLVLIIILLGILLSGFSPSSANEVDADAAAANAVAFIEENLVSPGTEVTVKNVTEEAGLYRMTIEVKMDATAQDVETYITKDGKIFFPQAINMEEFNQEVAEVEEEEQEETQIQKTDRPKAHAFVMSYCPYGLQFIKAYVPVLELLGEKAELEVNFVNYAMHGKKELDENTRMYCIQKEQPEKFTDYLRCFVENDDYEKCIGDAEVDSEMLDSCIQVTDEEFNITGLYQDNSTWSNGMFPLYPVEDMLNGQYAVRGSPTFVLNGEVTTVSRFAEAIKDAICSAFNEPPEECEEELNGQTENPGIGPIGSGSGSGSTDTC